MVKTSHVKLESALSALVDAVDAVDAALEDQVSEIEAAEVTMFAAFGFTHQTTPLMGKIRGVQARVKQHRAYLDMRRTPEHSRHISGDGEGILESFRS